MFDFLQTLISGMWEHEISRVFCLVILSLFVISLILGVVVRFRETSRVSKFQVLLSFGPGVLTSLGILGTFCGIYVALVGFDSNAIDDSLPPLLDGMKIAFGTSIVGLLTAIVLRICLPFLFGRNDEESVESHEVSELLNKLHQSIDEAEQTKKELLIEFRSALLDSESETNIPAKLNELSEHVKQFQASVTSDLKEQTEAFIQFRDHISEALSQALMKELKETIHEFNEKISEQFGDNFKELNSAVGNLLTWQDQYKQQLEELIASFDTSKKGIEDVRIAFSEIEKSSREIPKHMKAFSELNTDLYKQLSDLHKGLSSVATMREKAEGAFPMVTEKVNEMVQEIEDSATKIHSNISVAVDELITSQKQMLDGMQKELNEKLGEISNNLGRAVNEMDNKRRESMKNEIQIMADNLAGIVQHFVNTIQDLLKKMQENLDRIESNSRTQ